MSAGKPTLGLGGQGAKAPTSATAPRLTLEQQRARYAWEKVLEAQKLGGDYTNLVKAAPALIVNNGLMQALAFWQSKGKAHHLALVSHLLGWLHQRNAKIDGSYEKAMPTLYGMASADFRRATDEALALLRWLRQLAAARNP